MYARRWLIRELKIIETNDLASSRSNIIFGVFFFYRSSSFNIKTRVSAFFVDNNDNNIKKYVRNEILD